MKKIFTLISILSVSTTDILAQATPNAGFENWTNVSNFPFASYDTPDNWDNANPQTAIVGIYGCVKATGADVHSGSAAVKLITKNVLSIDAPGVVTTGTLPTSAGDPITGGIPYTLRPDSIVGWYKYTPQGGDNGFVEFMLFSSAANNADTVAKATFTTPATTVGAYTRFSAPLVYFSANAVANSIWLLSSSKDDVSPVVGSAIFADDLELIINPVLPVSVVISLQTNVSCFGNCTGSSTASASSGTSPYSYLWSASAGNQTTATATGLCAGTHIVTVTDATSDTTSVSITITQPNALSAAITTAINNSCNGGNNGTASVTASGGATPYIYSWSNGQSTATATGLIAGSYTVTVTDANSCTQTSVATISEPNAITITVNTINASCGVNDGTATASAIGGTGVLTYLWSTTATSPSISGLIAGAYTVTVTDANGCTQTATANVSNDGGPVASISSQANVSCNGGNNGSATLTASGGTLPYTYLWNTTPPQTTQTVTGLAAGNYSVSVADTSGCIGIASVSITEPLVLTTTLLSTPDSGSSNGTATVSASGGTTPYAYLWSAGATTAMATGLSAGNYSVTVTDINGCTSVNTVSVGSYAGIESQITNHKSQITIYPNPATQNIFIEANDAKRGVYEIKILSITGQVLHTEIFEHTGGVLRKEMELGATKAGWVLVQIISEDAYFVLPLMKVE